MTIDDTATYERDGWLVEHNGGGTHILRKGRLVLSGFDGDLPRDHWFVIGLYADWDDCLWSICDGTAEFADCGPAMELPDALAMAERQALAYEFAETLRSELSGDAWRAMLARNVSYPDGICASHDFCDANEPMAQAFEAITGRAFLPDDGPPSDSDVALWGDAWRIAKAAYLTAKTDNEEA